MGNIRSGRLPSKTEAQIAEFFFGAIPESGLGLVKPVSVAAKSGKLLICDSALNAVLLWDPAGRQLTEPNWNERPERPVTVRTAPNGDSLIVDVAQAVVLRYASNGTFVRRYSPRDESFRPAGAASIANEIWVSDAASHRLAVFESETGKLLRTIGGRGPGPAEFGAPLGLAVTPDHRICVVDTFNDRVQVLDETGKWLRDVGRPGNQVGCLGRPKDVAVGPDGVIFITDAASQRVHAFDASGRALLAFGEPESGIGALSMPAGICICDQCPLPDVHLPPDFRVSYYIAVAEQMREPGIRVYAWRSRSDTRRPLAVSMINNPHWSANNCAACHKQDQGRPAAITMKEADALCLSCHDGKKAKSEAHPIGRLASTAGLSSPSGWPLVNGRIGCLTCHDIRSHCDVAAAPPPINSAMVRDFDPDRRMDFCNRCHAADQFRRLNPHVQLDEKGSVAEYTCTVCHEQAPEIPPDGTRQGRGRLRATNSSLCLACHARHWDVSPAGHVDRLVTNEIMRNINSRREKDPASALPLFEGRVTCFTCHNPHQRGLFPFGSPLATLSAKRSDAEVRLRTDFLNLCLHCHAK